jgi:excisionase family DNA binding protein
MPDKSLTVDEIAGTLKLNAQTVRNWIDRGELPAVRVGKRRVRVRQSDLDAFIDAGSTIRSEPEVVPEMAVDEGSITAWATFGAALTEASASLDSADREQLVAVLDGLVVATRELVDVLRAAMSE